MKTTWTDQRLEKLFARYNRIYWRGRVPAYLVKMADLREADCIAICLRRERRIFVDVDQHESDPEVRATLLHEMCHAAAKYDRFRSHGHAFWQQLEALLHQGARIKVLDSEAPDLKIFAHAIPPKFRLCRMAITKLESLRQRQVDARAKRLGISHTEVLSKQEIMDEFEDAAVELPWLKALFSVGGRYGLIDVGGKPTSRRTAKIIANGKKVHQRYRKYYLKGEKRRKTHFSQ